MGKVNPIPTFGRIKPLDEEAGGHLSDEQWFFKVSYEPKETRLPIGNDWLEILAGFADRDDQIDETTERINRLLYKRTMQLAKRVSTTRQWEVFGLYMTGDFSQREIGAKLGICQTTVYKTIFGNYDYRQDKFYGGLIKKLIVAGKDDWICQKLLKMKHTNKEIDG